MLNGLKLWNFAAGTALPDGLCPSTFVLATCQRTMVLAFDRYPFANNDLPDHELHSGEAAYLYLLETICGLKSKLIGENEIVGQFKEAYKIYAASTLKDTKLLTILEKLFQDAKDIRTQYLIGISQKTYASLTRKHLIQKARAPHILILGSGQLAEDLINQFKKKARVTICARNEARVSLLAASHDIEVLPWENRQEMINWPFIANTIGCSKTIWSETFFSSWKETNQERLFVDLGSPSAIATSLSLKEGVVRLSDIFKEGAIVEGQKQRQIDEARAAMLSITHKRKSLLEAKLTRTSSVLTPQSLPDAVYL
jgi:glutamyl-tRNA reductase